MDAEALLPELVKLSTSHPDNLVVIENHSNGVLIRAARDNFSERGKSFFIRHLAAEGYIPERYEQPFGFDGDSSGLQWVVDVSLLRDPPSARPLPLRQLRRVLFYAALLWLTLMVFAFLHAPR